MLEIIFLQASDFRFLLLPHGIFLIIVCFTDSWKRQHAYRQQPQTYHFAGWNFRWFFYAIYLQFLYRNSQSGEELTVNLTAGFIPQGCIYYCHTTPWWCSGWLKYKMFNYSEFQFPFKGRDILLTNWRVFSRLVIILVRRFSTSKPVSTPQDACASMTALVVILWLNLRSNFTVIHSKSSN